MELVLIRAIDMFADVLITMLFIRAILSWFAQGTGMPLHSVYRILVDLTEPIVAPCRKLLSSFNTGMFDWSVLVAFIIIRFCASVLIYLVRIIL